MFVLFFTFSFFFPPRSGGESRGDVHQLCQGLWFGGLTQISAYRGSPLAEMWDSRGHWVADSRYKGLGRQMGLLES